MTTNQNSAVLNARYPNADAAFEALAQAGLDKAQFKATADQGEFILVALAKAEKPKAEGKASAKAKAKAPKAAPKAEGKAKGKKGSAKRIAAQGDLKAKPKAPEKDYGDKWRPVNARKWSGIWTDWLAKAEKGQMPDVGGAKLSAEDVRECKWFGLNAAGVPPFHAATHSGYEKRLLALCALIRSKDLKGLKAFEVKEISSTKNMIAKMRDLAIYALMAKEGKANGKVKAETPPAAPPAPPAEAAQAS
jgi:hypothetical protein